MRIGVMGAGYVGLVTAACLANASSENEVVLYDPDREKIGDIAAGVSPIAEPGMTELLSFVRSRNRLKPTTDQDALARCELVFIAVGTPSAPDGSADLSQLLSAVDILCNVAAPDTTIVIKSTVPPGTHGVVARMFERSVGLVGKRFRLVSSPEFLREGSAIEDFLNPDRVVVGWRHFGDEEKLVAALKMLYGQEGTWVFTTPESAELIKLASNAALAARVSFANELAKVCEKTPGAKVDEVLEGVGTDSRIGPLFLRPGFGYGGSCFPKDTRALLSYSDNVGARMRTVETTIAVNDARIAELVRRVADHTAAQPGSKVAILGLAFKAGTGDTRESPAFRLLRTLRDQESTAAMVHDPAARVVTNDVRTVLQDASVVVLATPWPEYLRLDPFELRELVKAPPKGGQPVVFDFWNHLDAHAWRKAGFEVRGIGIGASPR